MCTRKIIKTFVNKFLIMKTFLKLKQINLKYQTGKYNINVLKNINLNIKKKETVSVVGESGSGKTSLIMLIGGLEKPTSGKITFQNQEMTEILFQYFSFLSQILRPHSDLLFLDH